MPSLVNAARNPSWRRARSTLHAAFAACAIGSAPAGAQTGEPIGIILAAGDIAGCFQEERKYKEVAELIAKEREDAKVPIAVLALGDLAYSNSKVDKKTKKLKFIAPFYADCFKDFDATWGRHKAIMLPVPGNHEYSDDPTKAGVFKTYFNDRLKELGADMDGLFFSTRFPPDKPEGWLIAGLNMDAPGASSGRQADWFKKLVAAPTPRCVLAFAHHFFTSSGLHGREMKGMTEERMAKYFEVMHDGAATVLVAGHDHNLEQFDRQDPKGKASPTGVRSFVVGTGGAKLYTITDKKTHKLKKTHLRSQAFNDLTRGLLKLVLYADGYSWSFLPVPGEPPPDTPAIDLSVKQEGCNARRAPKS